MPSNICNIVFNVCVHAGENCHRGAALGALLGASAANQGQEIPAHLKQGLAASTEVKAILDQWRSAGAGDGMKSEL